MMTRALVKERLAQALDGIDGLIYSLGDWMKVNTVIDERLFSYSVLSYCVYDAQVDLTLTIDEPVYSLRDPAVLTKKVIQPVDIAINGTYLLDYYGRRAKGSLPEISEIDPRFLLAPSQMPRSWVWESKERIRFVPAPDVVYDDCWVSGWVGHPAIGGQATFPESVTQDAVAGLVQVPEEDVDTLCEWLALGFLSKVRHAESYGAFEGRCVPAMEAMKQKQVSRQKGVVIRGGVNGPGVTRLGRR